MAVKRMAAVFAIAYGISIASTGFSSTATGIPYFVRSPEALVEWLQAEFIYELKFPDHRQTPDETMRRRTGDCEDFALLSRAVLKDLGIASDVVIIKFREISVMHAVCIFRRGATFNFISNKEMLRTRGRSVTEAITEKFPDWEKIIYLTASGEFGKKVDRRYSIELAANNLAIPSVYGELLGVKNKDMGMIKQVLQEQFLRISKAGMPLSAGTFMTILREMTFDDPGGRSLTFLFKDLEITTAGFRAVCMAVDSRGTREYSIFFSLNRDKIGGFAAAVYSEEEWQRVKEYAGIMPRRLYPDEEKELGLPVEASAREAAGTVPAIAAQPYN